MAIDQRRLLLQNPKKRLKVYIFYFFVHLFKLDYDSGLAFQGNRSIKRANMVEMVVAKKKLAHPKKVAIIATPLAEKTTTPTPVVATTALTVSSK